MQYMILINTKLHLTERDVFVISKQISNKMETSQYDKPF
jgi:hypothetical protein